jgi:hypothetical protein
VIVIKLRNRAGAIGFERVDLGQISGIDEQQANGGSDQRGNQDQQREQHAAYELASRNFNRWKMLVERPHGKLLLSIAGAKRQSHRSQRKQLLNEEPKAGGKDSLV